MEWIKEHKIFIIAGIAATIFFSYSSFESNGEFKEIKEEQIFMNELQEGQHEEIPASEERQLVMMADVKGAVNKPGVYEINEEDRVVDVIELAGGLSADAEAGALNFAMRVTDEMVIYVPRKGESMQGMAALQTGHQEQEKKTVNLNKAAASELETLPGIGPSKAEAIIEYRETNGPYKTIEDLKSIGGIGDKTFEKLKDLISVK